MSCWELNYTLKKQSELYHKDKPQHRVLIGTTANSKEEHWFVLLHIGELAPDDTRYSGEDREEFSSRNDAWEYAQQYIDTHPNGHTNDSLSAPQKEYDSETGTMIPV